MERHGSGQDRSWVDDAAALLQMLAGTDLEQLEVEHEGARYLLRRDSRAAPGIVAGEYARPEDEPAAETFVVSSPLVGIFRRTPGGKAEPPIVEGDALTAGQAIGAVEAMRMMNRVQTERSGVVEKLLVEDGQAVEYGQPLILVRPSQAE